MAKLWQSMALGMKAINKNIQRKCWLNMAIYFAQIGW